jgi:hypothetical protein
MNLNTIISLPTRQGQQKVPNQKKKIKKKIQGDSGSYTCHKNFVAIFNRLFEGILGVQKLIRLTLAMEIKNDPKKKLKSYK